MTHDIDYSGPPGRPGRSSKDRGVAAAILWLVGQYPGHWIRRSTGSITSHDIVVESMTSHQDPRLVARWRIQRGCIGRVVHGKYGPTEWRIRRISGRPPG